MQLGRAGAGSPRRRHEIEHVGSSGRGVMLGRNEDYKSHPRSRRCSRVTSGRESGGGVAKNETSESS